MTYRIRIKRADDRAFRFGWGDPTAADVFLHPGAQKANPYHHGAGDDRGGEFTTRDDASVLFEVAPDPNDKELTRRWETLTAEEKEQVSRDVVKDITPEVLKALQAAGKLEQQIGGYDEYVNPCFALETDKAIEAAKLMGYALSQDSMAVVSSEPLEGLDPVSMVVVNLPQADMNIKALAAHYENLRQIRDESGQPLVSGFNASNGSLKILNFSGLDDRRFATLIDNQLDTKYNVYVDKGYSALIEKKDYLSAGHQETEGGTAAVWAETAGRIREVASRAINGELVRRGKSAVRYIIRRLMGRT